MGQRKNMIFKVLEFVAIFAIIYGLFSSFFHHIEKAYERHFDIKSCEFVCSHLEKSVGKNSVQWYPAVYNITNRFDFWESKGVGNIPYPLSENNTPLFCPCRFEIVKCRFGEGVCLAGDIIINADYGSWYKWYNG